jgi:hypothetical protein
MAAQVEGEDAVAWPEALREPAEAKTVATDPVQAGDRRPVRRAPLVDGQTQSASCSSPASFGS